jgi:hypothetical protein
VYWTDRRLIFNPDKYGVGSLFLSDDKAKEFWRVAVKFMNIMNYLPRESYMYVKSTGQVTSFSKGVTESHFETDFSLFPFDKQGICIFMRLGSEMAKFRASTGKYEGALKWADQNEVNLGHHTGHSVWTVLKTTSNSTVRTMGTKNTFDYLTACMIVQRRITNYVTKLLVPALLITLIACVSFWIDPRGEDMRSQFLDAPSILLVYLI